MSSNRAMFDSCVVGEQYESNKSALDYTMFLGKFENSNNQYAAGGMDLASQIDLESQLQQRGQPYSKCTVPDMVINARQVLPPDFESIVESNIPSITEVSKRFASKR